MSSPSPLPEPGEVLIHDFRPQGTRFAQDPSRTLRVFQWNIERGYELPQIIDQLKAVDPDIIALQEVDIECDRTACKDVGMEIAKALKMKHAFGNTLLHVREVTIHLTTLTRHSV